MKGGDRAASGSLSIAGGARDVKRILVTGASGFVGRHVLAPLAARGYEVHAASSKNVGTAIASVAWRRADLLDPTAASALVNMIGPTHLLHLAWCTQPDAYKQSPDNSRWLEASTALLQAFQRCGGRRAVVAGTCMEYDWNHGVCHESATPCRPSTIYGQCKLALKRAVDAVCEKTDLGGAWARLFFLYGPGEHPARLVSSVITALLRGETASCSHGQLARDYLYVQDVADALAALVDSDVRGAVNIAAGKATPLRDLVVAAAESLGGRDRVLLDAQPPRAGEPLSFRADTERLRTEVGFSPQYGLRQGMATTVAWWKASTEDGTCVKVR